MIEGDELTLDHEPNFWFHKLKECNDQMDIYRKLRDPYETSVGVASMIFNFNNALKTYDMGENGTPTSEEYQQIRNGQKRVVDNLAQLMVERVKMYQDYEDQVSGKSRDLPISLPIDEDFNNSLLDDSDENMFTNVVLLDVAKLSHEG